MLVPTSIWAAVHRLANRREWPPASPDEARRFIEQANLDGLLPLLFEAPDLPSVVSSALIPFRALRHAFVRRAEVFDELTAKLLAVMADEPFVVFKGSDYRHRLYPRPDLRPSQDIDVLIPLDRAAPLTARFEAAHFLRYFSEGARGHLRHYNEFAFDLGGALVELHTSLNYRLRVPIDYEAVWRRRIPFEAGRLRAFRLSDSDALIFHAVNNAKDEFSAPLIRYVDLWLLLRDGAPGLEQAAEDARRWGVGRALYGTLELGRRVVPELDTPQVRAVLKSLLPARTRRFLDRRVLFDPGVEAAGHVRGRAVQLWRKFWLIETPWRRLAYVGYHLYASVAAALWALRTGHPRGSHAIDPATGKAFTAPAESGRPRPQSPGILPGDR
jgi:hypothetical protein